MPRVLGIDQLLQKRYCLLQGLSPAFVKAHGELEDRFTACIYGHSGQGKSNYTMQLLAELLNAMPGEVALYVALEEGHGKTIQNTVVRQDMARYSGRMRIMDCCTYAELLDKLSKRKSPKIVVIDSVQYMGLTVEQYKQLKERFNKKIMLFISHASGRRPKASTAEAITYDANIKVRVEGFKALVTSRFGGTDNYVVWEDGAKKYWGKKWKNFHAR